MTIIESIRDFIQGCPFLDEFSKAVNVNYMDADAAVSYTYLDVYKRQQFRRKGQTASGYIFPGYPG